MHPNRQRAGLDESSGTLPRSLTFLQRDPTGTMGQCRVAACISPHGDAYLESALQPTDLMTRGEDRLDVVAPVQVAMWKMKAASSVSMEKRSLRRGSLSRAR